MGIRREADAISRFLAPPIVASNTGSVAAFYAVWLLGGLTSLAGAVACAELGTLMPKAGGDYVYQYEAFGPSTAFASGWVLFAAIFCGSIATMSVGVCTYQLPGLIGADLGGAFFELPWGRTLTKAEGAALLLVPLVTGVNTLGAKLTARTQTFFTVVPIALLALLAVGAIVVGGEAGAPVAPVLPTGESTLQGFVTAYMAVYFAYSGWINIIYVAGEVAEPQTNIPRALIWGTLVVTALYLLLCVAFVSVLGFSELREAGEVGTALAGNLGGASGEAAMNLLIACALLASINGTVLGGARVAYAMATRGAMWPLLETIGEHAHVPHRALWIQAALSVGLILSGKFEQLYVMVSLAMVVTGTLTVGSVFVLRRKQPEANRPYRATGYPWLPAIYVVSSIGVVLVMTGSALSGDPGAWYPLLGLGLMIALFFGHRLTRGRA